ncbi:MAG: SUMF1/EgtB/PvdO family nonheme iron enzyme [Planctomycetota bacterium]
MTSSNALSLSLAFILSPLAMPDVAAQEEAASETREERWARAAAEMQPYEQQIPGTDVTFRMVPIPGGVYRMGSPDAEPGRNNDEGPQRTVVIEPFWMAVCEVTWDEYDLWSSSLEKLRRPADHDPDDVDALADAVSRPTPPYVDMSFGMGQDGFPAICMTQKAANTYSEWLSTRTERRYRLPTEAEWEWAARGGTDTAYWFGNDASELGEHEWFKGNSEGVYHRVGTKSANPYGLHDILGNVSEWTLDAYAPYEPADGELVAPFVEPETEYPRVARGGSFQDKSKRLRVAARRASHPTWKQRDPQIPKSVWYHTDAKFLGFRLVRAWDPNASDTAEPGDGDPSSDDGR